MIMPLWDPNAILIHSGQEMGDWIPGAPAEAYNDYLVTSCYGA